MCTVSYIPTSSGYLLTSNRDEAPARQVVAVVSEEYSGISVLFPRDPLAGGTWYACSERGHVACLLNGAFIPFKPDPKYAHSRGLVVLDSFEFPNVDAFVQQYDFKRTAPFTLVLVRGDIHELIWDGENLHHTILDPTSAHFWSSVTLYPEDVRKWRNDLFLRWKEEHLEPTQEAIVDFHRYGSEGDTVNGFVMNRDEKVRTLSITSVDLRGDQLRFQYCDLDNGANNFERTIDVNSVVTRS